MEKTFAIPENEEPFASLIDQVQRGRQVRLLRKGQPLAMVIPIRENESNNISSYKQFRETCGLDDLEFNFDDWLRPYRYRGQDPGRDFQW